MANLSAFPTDDNYWHEKFSSAGHVMAAHYDVKQQGMI
jgi:hypothetical protein